MTGVDSRVGRHRASCWWVAARGRWLGAGTALAVSCAAALASSRPALAVACPSPGAKIEVCVSNPTGETPEVTIAGQAVSDEITCTGPAPILGGYQHTFTLQPGETCFAVGAANPPLPLTGGLVTGMYVHRIQVASPAYTQYQKGPVVFHSTGLPGGAKWTRISWTYHQTVLTVTSTGESSAACSNTDCLPGSCTLRQAIRLANEASTKRPVLIRFALPALPATITLDKATSGCGILPLGRGNVTIDGTQNDGRPWVVGDRTATEQGYHDSAPITLQLNGRTRFQITSTGNTLKGLDVRNALAPGAVQSNELVLLQNTGSGTNTLRAVRLDGGNTDACTNPSLCSGTADVINVNNTPSASVMNVEVRSALDKGVKVFGTQGGAVVTDSWLHHNYRGNVQATGGGFVALRDSVAELAGRRATDDAVVNNEANGVVANAGFVSSRRNLVERNRAHGLSSRATTPNSTHEQDIACGNRLAGLIIEAGTSNPTVNAPRLAAIFNGERGARLHVASSVIDPFSNSLAFVNNDTAASNKCDFENLTGSAVAATNNQWTGNVPRICSGAVTTSPIQNPVTTEIPDSLSADPSNVILTGQTVRILGSGFNAVAGNALGGGCVIGDTPGSNACCKRAAPLANVCAGAGMPPASGGHCVEVQDRLGTWHPMTVTAVSPTMIVTSIPLIDGVTPFLPCLGSDSRLRVSKQGLEGLDQGFAGFCDNSSAVEF